VHARRHSGCLRVRLPVADRQGSLKRFQATMAGGKLFDFSAFPALPARACLRVCTGRPAGQPKVFGSGAGGKPFFRHRTSSAWHGHSKALNPGCGCRIAPQSHQEHKESAKEDSPAGECSIFILSASGCYIGTMSVRPGCSILYAFSVGFFRRPVSRRDD